MDAKVSNSFQLELTLFCCMSNSSSQLLALLTHPRCLAEDPQTWQQLPIYLAGSSPFPAPSAARHAWLLKITSWWCLPWRSNFLQLLPKCRVYFSIIHPLSRNTHNHWNSDGYRQNQKHPVRLLKVAIKGIGVPFFIHSFSLLPGMQKWWLGL